jgi:flagellar FliL protein
MPDEELNKNEQEEPENEAAEGKPGLPLKKYGIYAAIVVVIMAAAYFVTLKVVKPMFAGNSEKVEEKVADKEKPKKKTSEQKGHKTLSDHGSESGEFAAGDVHLIEDIIVNPAGTAGRRFLSTSIGFELETAYASELMNEREAIVRDALITILSSQSIPELSDFKQRERLRKLIKLRVEKLLHIEDIAAVYFTEFVLQ